MTMQDLERLVDIDGTVESSRYLHLDRNGEGFEVAWKLEERPLRQKLIEPNRLPDETAFLVKQIVTGADEGLVLVAEYDDDIIALAIAQERPAVSTLHVHDLRIDYDLRRQGLGTALLYQVIAHAREREGVRAVSAETLTNNDPANHLLAKCGFELSGVDTRRNSNHDVVKEAATLLWYAPLD